MNENIIIYQSGEIELKIFVEDETIWLRQDEISLLFEKDRTVITRHINNILKDNEVDEQSNVQKMHIANSDKPVKRYRKHNQQQYPPIAVKKFKNAHDRFLILDGVDIYHIGASLKDLGKKRFAFSKFDKGALALLGRLENE